MRKLSLAMMGIATAALMTMVSCRKPVNGVVTPGEARTVTFTATTESNDGSKTAVDDHKILWKEGDEISVNGEKMTLASGAGSTEGTFTGTITTAEEYYIGYPAATTTYTSTNTLKLGIPSTCTYDANNPDNVVVPMAAYSTTEGDLQFYNAVNVLKLNLQGNDGDASKLTSIVLTHATENLSGDITVTFSGEPEFSKASGSKHAIVNFNGNDGQLTTETKSVYIVLPKIEKGDIKVTFFCANGKCMEKTIPWREELNKVNHLVSNNQELTVNAEATPSFIPCDFAVSAGADGKAGTTDDVKVLFSKGNLWTDATESANPVFHLEANQWGYMVGEYHEEDDEYYEYYDWVQSHVSHFYWSKTAGVAYAQEYNDPSVSNKDVFFAATLDVEGETWSTLSKEEWGYLLGYDPNVCAQTSTYGRTNAMELCKFVTLTVSGKVEVKGLVILPDGDAPSTAIPGTIEESYLTSNGAVFLPAAGERSGEDVNNVGSYVSYWSSTPGGKTNAYPMRFYSGKVEIVKKNRRDGYCVRLVR